MEKSFTEKLDEYLTPTLTLNHGEKPTTITAYYKETFNYIDRCNQMLGYISYPYKVKSKKLMWFIYTLSMAAGVNSYTLWMDLNYNNPRVGNKYSLKQYVRDLASALMKQ